MNGDESGSISNPEVNGVKLRGSPPPNNPIAFNLNNSAIEVVREEIVMMSRPMLLVFLLMVLIITSQFEWKQQLVSDVEPTPSMSQKQQQISQREEAVKEKIILSQEKNIQRLNELVRSLREQLQQCRNNNESMNGSLNSLAENIIELEQQQILMD
nr:Structural maintenance of chromosomes protein like [Ipomoea batatas]GMD12684.1 Structural maintenance of chromosomes protein like [Ipomoea batatas]GMD14433.1 Structural maintenance of chromosomes protein like [Ipomoea batatas]GMD16114.1 Structural maintenance of chromosomes protein like [Ipomoea batatas]GMD17831.1 Structural maintenance of chromosomes protein like [Ipomoea batatas]